MNIAFDAKRLFNNVSGLGNYSRNTISLLARNYKQHNYHLFTPYIDSRINYQVPGNCVVHQPKGYWRLGMFSSVWRSTNFGGELTKNGVKIFHGLSNEVPTGISSPSIKKVVTIHDLIFLRYPELYNRVDRNIYIRKFKYAAENSDIVISVSEFTKQELMEFYKIPESKIRVVYQTCNERFFHPQSDAIKEAIRQKYNLPDQFILSVGTIEKRKNLLNLLKAMVRGKVTVPLVVIGQSTHYFDDLKAYIHKQGMENQVLFFHQVPNNDLPAIYQMADVFVYISIIEGFGIPVLEAMASGVPVITTKGTTMEESGKNAYRYVDPLNVDEVAGTLNRVLGDRMLQKTMISEGIARSKMFSGDAVISDLHNVYTELM